MINPKAVNAFARQLVLAATQGGAGFEDVGRMAGAALDAAEAMFAEQERRKRLRNLPIAKLPDGPPAFNDQPSRRINPMHTPGDTRWECWNQYGNGRDDELVGVAPDLKTASEWAKGYLEMPLQA